MMIHARQLGLSLLRCPQTGEELALKDLEEAELAVGGPLVALRLPSDKEAQTAPPFGATPTVLLRSDGRVAYPVVDGVPILLAPEALGLRTACKAFDLSQPRYAEAYAEMRFYNELASEQAERVDELECFRLLEPLKKGLPAEQASQFLPREKWLDATYDSLSQSEAYGHLAPVDGARLIQLGGQGYHAVKFLLAGAAEAWAVTPMLGEAKLAMALARAVGVEDRLRCVVSIAEELALSDDAFDGVYSGGCVHHMVTDLALAQVARVLRPGGKFSAVDPWKTPFHDAGTRLLGKREAVHCRPLTSRRVEPLFREFEDAKVVHHGALTRHLLLAVHKAGLKSSLAFAHRIGVADDFVSSLAPGLRRLGSSVALIASKGKQPHAAELAA